MKTILLNWSPERKALLDPFIELNKKHVVFVIVWFKNKPSYNIQCDIKQVYFSDFNSPYHLLSTINPDKILFFNIESYYQISLNLAAKNLGIKTFMMHHGLYQQNGMEIASIKLKIIKENIKKSRMDFKTILFYVFSLRLKNITTFYNYITFAIKRRKNSSYLFFKSHNYEFLKPDIFIQLSEHNATITKKIYNLSSNERFRFIGHPFNDEFFPKLSNFEKNDKYFLLIDSHNTKNVFLINGYTYEDKINFYKKLGYYANKNGAKLKIKLHPASYDNIENPLPKTIEFIRDSKIDALISGALGCFAFYSTLIIPIIYHSNCCVVKTKIRYSIQEELMNLNLITSINFFGFEENDIYFLKSEKKSKKSISVFIKRYVYLPDGKSTERLGQILKN